MLRRCRSAPVAALKPMSTRRELPESPYLAAVTGRKPSRVPVWFMRQAGRSLPEYRALRERHSMLAACFEPELACEITLQPIRRHDVDAAILFSDIVVPLRAAGVDLDIVADVGPVIAHPVRTDADIDAMKPLDPQAIQPVLRGGFAAGRRAGRGSADRFRRRAVHAGVLPGRGRPQPQPRPHQGDDAGRTGELACADVEADRPHHRVPARPNRRRGGRHPDVRFVGGHAVAGRLPPIRAAAQRAGVRHAGRIRRADDALRGRDRRTAGRHVGGCAGPAQKPGRAPSSASTGEPR